MIRFTCPNCKTLMEVRDDQVGAKGSCPKCGQRIQVPAPIHKTVLGELDTAPTVGDAGQQSHSGVGERKGTPAFAGQAGSGVGEYPQERCRFSCPSCSAVLEAPLRDTGTKIHCPRCNQRILIPPPARSKTILGDALSPGQTARDPALQAPSPAFQAADGPLVEASAPEVPPLPSRLFSEPVRPRRALDIASRLGPVWRYASPSCLCLALVMFFLPWVDVRCNPSALNQGASRLYPSESRVVFSQSGLQAAIGTGSRGAFIDAALTEWEKKEGTKLPTKTAREVSEPGVHWAPLLLLHVLLVIAGLVCAFIVRPRYSRLAGVGALGAAAALVLLVQFALGFPVERQIAENVGKSAENRDQAILAAATLAAIFEVSATPWFWLAFAFTGACPVLAAAEWVTRPKPFAENREEFVPEPGTRQTGLFVAATLGVVAGAIVVAALVVSKGLSSRDTDDEARLTTLRRNVSQHPFWGGRATEKDIDGIAEAIRGLPLNTVVFIDDELHMVSYRDAAADAYRLSGNRKIPPGIGPRSVEFDLKRYPKQPDKATILESLAGLLGRADSSPRRP